VKNITSFVKKRIFTKDNRYYLLILLGAIALRTQVIDSRYIPSESMMPTLRVNDRVGGFYTHQNIPNHDDIIVFRPDYIYNSVTKERLNPIVLRCGAKGKTSDSINVEFIKRVIGLPGDKLDFMFDGTIKRNGKILHTSQAAGKTFFPNISNNFRPMYKSVIVNKDHVFVMGDNRERSCDSRYWGNVPIKNIISKAQIRFWPPNRFGFMK
jgi:signal peptidase I